MVCHIRAWPLEAVLLFRGRADHIACGEAARLCGLCCCSRLRIRSCEILPESQCITTSSFPQSFYGSYEQCTIQVADNNTWPLQVLAFKTGSEDSLMVNGQSYSGTTGPADVVPQGSIEWRAVSHLRSDPPCLQIYYLRLKAAKSRQVHLFF